MKTVFFSLRGSVRSSSKYFSAGAILSAAIVLASIPPIAAAQATRSLVFSKTGVSLTEAAGPKHTATYTVALASQPTASVTVSLSSGDEDAATVLPAKLTFTTDNWQDVQTVTVTAVDDNVQNDQLSGPDSQYFRQFHISHTALGGGYDSITGSVMVDVFDNDFNPTFSIADAQVSEGDSGEVDLNFTVTLSPATVTKTRVLYRTANGSATAGEDYTGVNENSLHFEPGDSSKTVTIKVKGDVIDENNETLTVTLSRQGRTSHNTPEGIKIGTATATGTITDDDAAPSGITLVASPDSVTENGGAKTVTVTASVNGTTRYADAKTVAVTVGKSGDSATEGTDYSTVADLSIAIAAGAASSSKSFTLTPTNDVLDEENETISVEGTLSGVTVTADQITITDDDAAPSGAISLQTSQRALAESSSSTEVTVTATLPGTTTRRAATEVTVKVGEKGTATEGTDYATVADFKLTIAAGERSGTAKFSIDPTQDAIHEGVGETVGITGSTTVSGLTVGETSILIVDDDGEIELKASPSSVAESAASTEVTVTAKLLSGATRRSATEVTVKVGEKGTATEGTDYATVTDFTLTIAAGQRSGTATFSIDPTQDAIDEGTGETVGITGSTTASGLTVGETSMTITDDDEKGIVLSKTAVTVTEVSGTGNTASYTVKLASQPTAGVTVEVSSGDTSTATVNKASLSFSTTNWNQAQTVTVTGKDDSIDNTPDRTATVSHSASGGDYGSVRKDLTVTVADDEATGITLVASPDSVTENGGAKTVKLTASVNGSTRYAEAKTVTVAVGKSTDSATEGTDYATVADLSIRVPALAASVSKSFTLTPTNDAIDEGAGETISVAGTSSVPVTADQITITDDDTRGVALSKETLALSEGGAHKTYTLKLLSQPTEKVTINVSGNPSGSVVLQYQGTSSSSAPIPVTFDENDWNRPKTITVRPTSDDDHEDYSGSIVHTVEGYGDFTAADSISVTVTDSSLPGVLLRPLQVSLKEGETATYTVKLATRPSGTVTVTPISDDTGIATVSGPLSLNSTNWKSGLTVTVTGAQDENGATDTTSISHTVAGYHDDITRVGPVSVTVADDDAALVLTRGENSSITKDTNVFVYEGLPITEHQKYKVRLAAQPGGTVTVTPVSQDGTRVTVSGPLTFDTNNWAVDQIIELKGLLDDDGYNEQVKINHTVTGYDAEPVSVNTIVRDYHGHTLVVEPRTLGIHEGMTGTYSVKLRTNPKSVVTVTPGVDNESAASVSGALTFNSTNWSIPQNVTVTVKEDEERGRKSVTLTNEVSGYSGYRKTHPGGWYYWGNENPDVSTVALTTDDARPGLGLFRGWMYIREGVTVTTPLIRLAKEPFDTVTVSVGSLDKSIATVSPPTIEFTVDNWNVYQEITVTGEEDEDINENPRQTEIVFTTTGDYADADANMNVFVTDNDTRGLMLSRDAVTVTEADGPGHAETYTVALTTRPTAEVTVSLSSADDEAATVSPAELTFSTSNWNVGQTVKVTGVRDYLVNDTDRTTEISHTASGGDYGGITGDKVAVTVTDDDVRGLALSRDAVTVTEAAGPGRTETYTVALTTKPTAEVTVNLSSGDGGVATISSPMLTFSANNWKVGQTVTVTGVDDDFENDSDRTTEISHTASGGDYGEITGKVAVTVTDDDTRGLALSRDAVTVTEATGDERSTTYTVALTTQPDAEVTVSLSSGNNSTAKVSPATLTFTVGNWENDQTVTVTAVDDDLDNNPERTTTIAHTASGGDYGAVTGEVTVAVTDDDTRGLAISVNQVEVTEADGDEHAKTYTVALTSQPTAEVTVKLSSGNTDAATVSPAKLTFTVTKWSAPQTVTVTGVDDEIDQTGDFGYRYTDISHAASGGDYDTVSGSVEVNVVDADGSPSFYIQDAEVSEGDSGDVNLTFTVLLSPTFENPSIVRWTTSKESTDTAIPGVDYEANSGALDFGANQSSKTLSVVVKGDRISEGDETLTVTLSGSLYFVDYFAVHGDPRLGRAAATGTIIDDDAAPSGAISLSVTPVSVAESASATTATVTAQLPGTTTRSTDTAITVKVGDAADAATEGTDYATVDDFTLTIPAGASSGTAAFSIDPKQDTVDEGAGETLSISGTTSASGLSVSATQMTITDDDATPTLTLALSKSSIPENGGESTVTATLSGVSSAATTVTVSADAVSPAVSGDFTLSTNKTLTIAAGETSSTGTVTITGVDNSVDAPNKTVTMSGAASGGHGVADPSSQTLTITDDDDAPSGAIVLSVSPKSVAEADPPTTATVTATLPGSTTPQCRHGHHGQCRGLCGCGCRGDRLCDSE